MSKKVEDDRIPTDQPEWQEGEREADEDIAAGRVMHFENVDEFVAHLEKLDAEAAAEDFENR